VGPEQNNRGNRVVFRAASGQDALVLWPQLVGTVAFAVLLGSGFSVWRRHPAGQRNRELAGVLIAGTIILGIWVVALTLTVV